MTDERVPSTSADEFSPTRNGLFFPDEHILRPTWDRAFKAIFLDHTELTLKFITDFFDFESPIVSLSFLSTEIEPQGYDAKSVRLDVALKLSDGTLIDLEMQTNLETGYLRRCVLCNALLLASHTKKSCLPVIRKKDRHRLGGLIENRTVKKINQSN